MKFLICSNCQDFVKLGYRPRYCECRKVGGKHIDRKLAVYWGDALAMGLSNTDLMQMLARGFSDEGCTEEHHAEIWSHKKDYEFFKRIPRPCDGDLLEVHRKILKIAMWGDDLTYTHDVQHLIDLGLLEEDWEHYHITKEGRLLFDDLLWAKREGIDDSPNCEKCWDGYLIPTSLYKGSGLYYCGTCESTFTLENECYWTKKE